MSQERELVGEMRDMLEECQWAINSDGETECPVCLAYKVALGEPRPGYGQHYEECRLAALLKRVTAFLRPVEHG
jgi:hypothetical protein